MGQLKEYAGEFIGTFILVLFGCGAVAGAVLFGAFTSLLEVALIWGFGVTIAIFTTKNLCPAHLNPAVSMGMWMAGKLSLAKLPAYIISQLFGAMVAGLLLRFAFNDALMTFEANNQIIRGSEASIRSAMMFGEYFPNPGFSDQLKVNVWQACGLEAFGTFILVFVIFRLTERQQQIDNLTPVLIGLTVTLIITLVAPFTQAGLNPARDFGPRLIAYFGGWGNAAFPPVKLSFFTVYIASPIAGGIVASLAHKWLKNP